MVLDEKYRDKVGQSLTLAIATAIENGEIVKDDLSEISGEILDGIKKPTTTEEMIVFLEELSAKWSFFKGVLAIEKGEASELQVGEKTQQITDLIKDNNMDKALEVAQSALTQE